MFDPTSDCKPDKPFQLLIYKGLQAYTKVICIKGTSENNSGSFLKHK